MKMRKKDKDKHCYIVELPLITEIYQEDIINTRLECGRQIYNALLSKVIRRYREMIKTKRYRNLIEQLSNDKNKNKEIWKIINQMYQEFGLTKNCIMNNVKLMQHHFKCHLHSRICQNIAIRVYDALSSILFKNGEELHFKKFGQFNSLQSNEANQAIIFRNNYIEWTGLILFIKYPNNKKSAQYIEQNVFANINNLKYCTIVRKEIRGRYKYYVQLTFEGVNIKNRYSLGIGRVGIDIGTSTVAISSDTAVNLFELAEGVQELEKIRNRLLRKMDRSKRAMNPNKYNSNGTIKHGNKDKWVYSKRYKNLRKQLREIYRKQTVMRKLAHNKLSNYILSLGDEFYVETMKFSALQKRSKKPTEYKKNGKCKRKKRFGKSIGNRAPSMLLSIINRKLFSHSKKLVEINTQKCKASQFNHISKTYNKKSLNQRWNDFNGKHIQRDLYSAFLISNVANTLDNFNLDLCNAKYENFINLHDEEINRLTAIKEMTNKRFLTCMGI